MYARRYRGKCYSKNATYVPALERRTARKYISSLNIIILEQHRRCARARALTRWRSGLHFFLSNAIDHTVRSMGNANYAARPCKSRVCIIIMIKPSSYLAHFYLVTRFANGNNASSSGNSARARAVPPTFIRASRTLAKCG